MKLRTTKSRARMPLLAGLLAILLAIPNIALAGRGGGPDPEIAVTVNDITVSGTAVTVSVTSESTVSVNVESNVIALACAGSTLPQSDCVQAADGEVRGSLNPDETMDFTVSLPSLPAGEYVFRARVTASHAKGEDVKFALAGATVF